MSKKTNFTKCRTRVINYAAALALALLLQVQLMAQQKIVTGKVVNTASGAPIVGASIIVKGTKLGGTTDEKGNFSISVPASATTLTVSYAGFAEQTVAVSAAGLEIKLTSLGDL